MRPRVLLVPPHVGWSFDHIARQLERRLSDRFDISVRTLQELTATDRYDLTVTLLWTISERVRWRLGEEPIHLSCLFDHASTIKEHSQKLLMRAARNMDGWIVGSAALEEVARSFDLDVLKVCPDGVDLDLFQLLPPASTFTVGWCGNVAIGDGTYKGLHLIEQACASLGVPLVTQRYEQKIPQVEMPEKFYSRISVYVCASIAEGTPNPVLEALACGRPVITTRVGITEQVVTPECGIFVERSKEAIRAAIREVRERPRSPAACRRAVEAHGWDVAAERWATAIQMALDRGKRLGVTLTQRGQEEEGGQLRSRS